MKPEGHDQAAFTLSKMDNELLDIIARRNETTRVAVIRKWIHVEARRLVQPLVDEYDAEAMLNREQLLQMDALRVLQSAD